MTDFNRSAFKGSSLNSIKDEQSRANKALPKMQGGNRAGFHTIEDGKNWRRIAPAHSENEPAYRAKSTITLECEVPDIDENGQETGKSEVKKKNVFIAMQHSLTLTDDPILIYISYVMKRADDEIQDKDARTKFLSPINGWRGKDKKWNWGIRPSVVYVCYCWNDKGELGREQLFPGMLDQIKKISVERNEDSVEIVPDIFTDPDEGYPLIITKAKNDKDKWEMSCSCELPGKKESWTEFFERVKVTDAQLVELVKKESLRELYEDVYTMRDFNMAVDGLRRFDVQYKFGIFENEEFLDRLTILKKLVPEYKPKNSGEEETPAEEVKGVEARPAATKLGVDFKKRLEEKKAEETSKSATNYPTPVPAMKRIIKEYISENYGADYSLPDLSKEDLIKWYELAQAGEELPFDDTEAPTEEKNDVKKFEKKLASKEVIDPKSLKKEVVNAPKEPAVDSDLAAQIAALRKKRGAK